MRRGIRTGLAALVIAIAACSEPATGPVPGPGLPEDPGFSKQGTTHGQMLLHIYDPATGDVNVARMNDDGTGLVVLRGLGAGGFEPAWDPDGKRIVFSSPNTPPVSLYMMNDDGTGVTRLTHGSAFNDLHPVGFAKGIVFERSPVASPATSAVFLLDAGGGLTQLTSGPGDFLPAPSPKGKQVAFVRGGDIWVLDLASGGETNLTNTPHCVEFDSAYSPSGKQIAFAVFACGVQNGIFVMQGDGTRVTRLTTNVTVDESPKWSPDGKRIAFTRINASGRWTVHVMNADGTGLTELIPPDPTMDYFLSAWARY